MAAANYDRLLAGIPQLKTPFREASSSHVFHQYTLTLESEELRNRIRGKLSDEGIQSMVYYPRPLHLHPAYASARFPAGFFPVSENLSNRVLSLPIHSEMTEDIVTEISGIILSAI